MRLSAETVAKTQIGGLMGLSVVCLPILLLPHRGSDERPC
jgi:hypothetical protein